MVDEADQWNPACWSWTVPDLSHLDTDDPLVEGRRGRKSPSKVAGGSMRDVRYRQAARNGDT